MSDSATKRGAGQGQLALSRLEGEKIILLLPSGDRISVTVVSARGGKARVSLRAPRCVRIYREEVCPAAG